MLKTRTKIAILATLLTALLGSQYWYTSLSPKSAQNNPISNADYYFKNVTVKNFEATGKLGSQLKAEKMEYFKQKNTSVITRPNVIFKTKNNTTWQLKAMIGILDNTSNTVELDKNVSIIRLNSTPQSSIFTESLTINLDKKLATSTKKVKIISQNTTTKANGIIANFAIERIMLTGPIESYGYQNDW